jgi:2-methylaconitate cis-trans-isomerase PrpF
MMQRLEANRRAAGVAMGLAAYAAVYRTARRLFEGRVLYRG